MLFSVTRMAQKAAPRPTTLPGSGSTRNDTELVLKSLGPQNFRYVYSAGSRSSMACSTARLPPQSAQSPKGNSLGR